MCRFPLSFSFLQPQNVWTLPCTETVNTFDPTQTVQYAWPCIKVEENVRKCVEYVGVCVCVCVGGGICVDGCGCLFAYVWACDCVCLFVYVRICVRACLYVWICVLCAYLSHTPIRAHSYPHNAFIDTHTHVHIQPYSHTWQ